MNDEFYRDITNRLIPDQYLKNSVRGGRSSRARETELKYYYTLNIFAKVPG